MNCAPRTAGGLVDSIQVKGRVKWSVDCNVNPTAFVDQERISSFPLGLACKDGRSGTVPRSATLWPLPAAMAVTPLQPAGTVVWPIQSAHHATTLPSFFKATVCCPPAAMAVTPLCAAASTVVWPAQLAPHATTVPGEDA